MVTSLWVWLSFSIFEGHFTAVFAALQALVFPSDANLVISEFRLRLSKSDITCLSIAVFSLWLPLGKLLDCVMQILNALGTERKLYTVY